MAASRQMLWLLGSSPPQKREWTEDYLKVVVKG
jgi:hypothetical protein